MTALRYLSVCSGIEAASVAWEPLGWVPAAFSEIEPFPRAVLAHRFPGVPVHGDFTTIKGDEYGPVDLLVGGTPCQSFSIAGLRGGLDDDRGNLALEYLRLADRARPRWLVWENVPGVLSSGAGRDFGAILGGMAELGYGFAYRVLDAQFVRVDGHGRAVPQRRRRVFVVGYLGDWRRAAAVLFDAESLRGNPPPRREAGERVAGTLAASTGGCSGKDNPAGRLAYGGGNTSGSIDIAACLVAKGQRIGFEVETFIAHALRAEGFDASEDGTGRGTPLVPIAFTVKDHGGDAGEVCPTLRGGGHSGSHANGGVMPAIAFPAEMSATQVAATAELSPALSVKHTMAVQHQWAVRRLTPTECERLQGFPDGWTDVPYRGKPASDGPRYKALGNSMAVNVMRRIGRRIEYVERIVAGLERAA